MTYDDDIYRAIRLIQDDIKAIIRRIEKLEKRPDMLFKDEWMDGHDVCRALNISDRHLRTLRESGLLPYSRIQKKIYYKVSDLKTLLEKNRIWRPQPPTP